MSQARLGQALGITMQQIQKYESGYNRITSSRLYAIARALDTPISYFFDGVRSRSKRRLPADGARARPLDQADPLVGYEALVLVRAYEQIRAPAVRKSIRGMLKSMARIGMAAGRKGPARSA